MLVGNDSLARTLYFKVRWPGLSDRVRSNFESKIREDNRGYVVNVLYKEHRHKDREVVLSLLS